MADKTVPLSIVLRTVDNATAGIRAFKQKIEAITAPTKALGKELSGLGEAIGIPKLMDGLKGVGSAVSGLLGKVALVGGVAGLAVHGLVSLVDEFDKLGDLADRLGVHVDFLAQMRFAAERSGAEVGKLDEGLQAFTTNLGQARAGTGRMVKFLQTVSPALLAQLQATKSTEQATLLLADAMAKLKDPAKRAALAAKTGFGPELAPMLALGAKGIAELMDRYHDLAGAQGDAAEKAGAVDDSFKDLKASTDGIKAALLTGLAPAMKIVVDKLRDWFVAHRDDIKQWASDIGDKIPAAVDSVVGAFKDVIGWVTKFVDGIGGLRNAAIAVAAIIAGPLTSAIAELGIAILTTPVGWILAGMVAIGVGVFELLKHWDGVAQFFVDLWDVVKGAFSSAWDWIKGIVDKVVGAVSKVKDAISSLNPFAGPSEGFIKAVTGNAVPTDVLAAALGRPVAGASGEAHVKVDFANAPRGTRVTADPQSTADVDLSVGYQLGGAM